MNYEHSEQVTGALEAINEDSKALVAVAGEVMTAYGGTLYMMDFTPQAS